MRCFFFNDTATTEIYTLSLHDALPIFGLYAGLRPHSPLSKGIMAGSILGFSLPTFWVGLMLIMVFAVQLGWLPSTGDRKSTRLNSSHANISYAVFCLKKKKY